MPIFGKAQKKIGALLRHGWHVAGHSEQGFVFWHKTHKYRLAVYLRDGLVRIVDQDRFVPVQRIYG
jgi:hypothetical protein